MDSFSLTASSFSSFAFSQAGTFLFQFNPETEQSVFADPDLLPELKNLRLAHSLIRQGFEKTPNAASFRLPHSRKNPERIFHEKSPVLPTFLTDLTSYTNAVRKCSATAQHLRLQSDPRFLKDTYVISRQRELFRQVREARRCSELLQYQLDEKWLPATRLDVTSEDVQNWLDVSLFPNYPIAELSPIPGVSITPGTTNRLTLGRERMIWYRCTNDGSDKLFSLEIARRIANSQHSDFAGYIPLTHSCRQLDLVDFLCHILQQLVVSEGEYLSVVIKTWFLSHKNTRPSLEDAQRILLNELRTKNWSFLVFSGTDIAWDDLEALLPFFQDIMQTACKLFVICPFALPARFDTNRVFQVTGANFQSSYNDVIQATSLDWCLVPRRSPSAASPIVSRYYKRPSSKSRARTKSQILPQHGPYQLGSYHFEAGEELRKLADDTTPIAQVSLKILVWLAFALGSLTASDLQAATTDDHHGISIPDSLNQLEFFVQQSSHHRGFVYLRHGHQLPFLRQRLHVAEGMHADGPHALIAERCLSYIGSIFSMGKLPEDNDEFDERLDQHPFLQYAGTFWAKHACQVISPSAEHTNRLIRFLEPRHVEEICALMLSRLDKITERYKGAYKGMTGLHIASALGLVKMVSQMIESGNFSPCLQTHDGWTALHWAVENNQEEVVRFLLALPDIESLMACKTVSEGFTALHFAIKRCQSSTVELMLKIKSNINAQDIRGRTPLYLAVWNSQEDVMKQLLSSGADPNIRSIYGTTLHCAVKRGTPDFLRLLVSASGPHIDINIKDVLSQTALQEAQARGRDDIAEILLQAGANPSPDITLAQASFLSCHRGLSSKDVWQAYEVDSELSAQLKVGNQCICHVLKPNFQEPKHTNDQDTLAPEAQWDCAAPARVFRKTFDLANDARGQVQKYLLSEWQILFKLQHPHIVRYIDSDEDPHDNEFLLYMEYCDKGDLESFHRIKLKDLTGKENKRYGFVEGEVTPSLRPLTGVEVWAMIWQMASALAYLHYGLAIRHQNGLYKTSLEGSWTYIIHRDVKPANIVMHSAEKDKVLFKLCDLGIASHAGLGPDQNQTQLIGSSGLQPPEVRQGELWTTRGDMFSLGETIRLTAKLKDELLDCQPFKGFLDAARGIDEDSRPTSLEAMEVAYSNLRTAPGSFSTLPQAVIEEMRAVHQVLGRWGGSYLFQSFLLTAEQLDSPQPFQQGTLIEVRRNLVKRLWLLLDDGAEESFQGNYELTAHLLILLEGRSTEEKLSREQSLHRFLTKPANANRQWAKSGWSTLHIAAQEGKLSAFKTLLQHGARIDLKDNFGKTAKDYAEENGLQEMVAVLEGQIEETVVKPQEEMGGSRKRRKLI